MSDMEADVVGEELAEKVWKRWILEAAGRGIGKKKISELSKSWWSVEVERVIKERREVCQRLRQAKQRGAAVDNLWEIYRQKRRQVKRVIQKEKKENRKRTLQRIIEQGGPSCKLFWTDLRGKKKGRKL